MGHYNILRCGVFEMSILVIMSDICVAIARTSWAGYGKNLYYYALVSDGFKAFYTMLVAKRAIHYTLVYFCEQFMI